MEVNILVVEDEKGQRERLQNILSDEGHSVDTASSGKDALTLLKEKKYHILLLDIVMPGMSGMEVLKVAREKYPSTQVIMLTAYGTTETAVESMKLGAYDYVTKPYTPDELMSIINRAAEYCMTMYENLLLTDEMYKAFPSIVWKSEKMREVLELIESAARNDLTVLITGETGTGKELVAAAIHKHSERTPTAYFPVNCAAFTETLLESELFGYAKGAFTGAMKTRHGIFEVANGGTIFMDEISEASPRVQSNLLRILEQKEFHRVGDTKLLKTDVRVICGTNKDLMICIKNGTFRDDLYYRLNFFRIDIPPLRGRREDIPLLVNHFLSKYNTQLHKKIKSISEDVSVKLLAYDWHGNVRELENVIAHALAKARSDIITSAELPAVFNEVEQKFTTFKADKQRVIEKFEKEYLSTLLLMTKGNLSRAARLSGIARNNLRAKLRRYNITTARGATPHQTVQGATSRLPR